MDLYITIIVIGVVFLIGFFCGLFINRPYKEKKPIKKTITERYVERLEKENESLNRHFHNSMKMGNHDD